MMLASFKASRKGGFFASMPKKRLKYMQKKLLISAFL